MSGGPGGAAASRLLVVEDEPRIASFLVKGLQHHGFAVTWVTTAEAAGPHLEAGLHDLVLLDLGLPDVDGLDLLREHRARGMTTPVLVITGRTDPRDRATAQELGVAGYLTKPFGLAALLSAVRSGLPDGIASR